MALNQHVAALLLAGLALPAAATCPMFDRVRYLDLDLTVHENTNFPETSEYSQWARTWSFCSAMNQGRAIYEVAENKVFLVGFRACSSERKASDIYAGATDRVAATWLNGELHAYGGKSFCLSGMCMIGDTKFTFTLQDGVVTSVRDEQTKECRGAK